MIIIIKSKKEVYHCLGFNYYHTSNYLSHLFATSDELENVIFLNNPIDQTLLPSFYVCINKIEKI